MTYLFGTTLLLSAFLLFWLEPLIGKILLPVLGGVPAVWNTCMMFFQGGLLAGYGYAHLSSRFLSLRLQIMLQVLLLFLALSFLPISEHILTNTTTVLHPVVWLFSFLTMTIGVPFLIISATAPLLQNWYAKLQVTQQDPYFLYSASNLGSMLALLAFPLLLEPRLYLQQQNIWWRDTFLIFLTLLIVCAVGVWRGQSNNQVVVSEEKNATLVIPNTFLRFRWILLAFVPSSLLLSVTTYLTADVAAVPLLWVVPLALYILSFIIVFSRRPILSHALILKLQPVILMLFVTLPLVDNYLSFDSMIILQISIYLILLFIIALACHGELVANRPQVKYLTEFYLWIAVGGMLGSVFNVLLAPHLFNDYWELPLVLILSCVLRPRLLPTKNIDWLLGLLLLLLFMVLIHFDTDLKIFGIVYSLIVILIFSQYRRSLLFAFGLAVLLLFSKGYLFASENKPIFQQRNFFGVVKIFQEKNLHLLLNGTTIHGVQNLTHNKAILAYYWPLAPLFQFLNQENEHLQVGIVGLGTGSLACYARPQDQFVFYEINPVVIKIANNTKLFSFLALCAPMAKIIIGDARQSLRQAEPGQYNVLILDAFNSDAVPVHLMTLEAVQLYQQKMANNGIILFHISNHYLDLAPVLQAIAAQQHLTILRYNTDYEDPANFIYQADWIAMTQFPPAITALEKAHWQVLPFNTQTSLWRDDFSNIFSVIR